MADRLLRSDEHGLYVRTGGYTFRPLDALRRASPDAARQTSGWQVTETSTHAAGDRVPARHLAGSQVASVGGERWYADPGHRRTS